jgi:hypothetical protein
MILFKLKERVFSPGVNANGRRGEEREKGPKQGDPSTPPHPFAPPQKEQQQQQKKLR